MQTSIAGFRVMCVGTQASAVQVPVEDRYSHACAHVHVLQKAPSTDRGLSFLGNSRGTIASFFATGINDPFTIFKSVIFSISSFECERRDSLVLLLLI